MQIQSYMSVSYTHLDVYKRQVLISPSGERTRQVAFRQGYRYNFVFTFERTEVMVEYRLLLENNDSQPVSYTHLDVYKRQTDRSAGCAVHLDMK